ncbi:MAG TPA: glycosyltransferase family 2 protein [Candidatus Competibacteraceae bacterium]|nr:glycosyltransferase family 2 protein [Candidatus Competibacteraceae bacterium]
MSQAIQLSVVIPVYNEADNLAPLLAEVCAALDGTLHYEIIVVDDGSADDTSARLRTLQAQLPALRVLRHARNYGQSAALRSGIRAARAAWVGTLDGDGQNDPTDLLRLWRQLHGYPEAQRPRLLAGQRQHRQDDWLRRLSSRIANAVRGRLLGDATPDTGCGLKLIQRQAFLELPFFDHMHRFLPALIQRDGGRVVSVPVNHRPRRHGRSKYGVWNRLWVGIVDLAGVLWLIRRGCVAAVEEEKN